MITRKDIIQGTPEWHEVRWAKVGGTRSKGLFTKGDTLYLEMLAEYTEQYVHEESYQSAAMERGNELEPEAIFEMMQYTGVQVESVGWLQSVECPILGISPDAITEDETICFEVKCPSAKKHVENCLSSGAMKPISVEPAIIWQDNELTVTLAASTDDMVLSGKATVEAAPKKAPRKSRAKK
jgi:hypothetical protein